MVFSVYGYKYFHNENKEEWPIQPPTQDAWNEMLREDFRHCESNPMLVGGRNIPKGELPCYHPHWKRQSKNRTKMYILDIYKRYIQCKKNPNKIKFLFNSSTGLDTIKSQIKNKCNEIDYNPKFLEAM